MPFLYFQSIVQYRVPIELDGTLGEPQITKKFTTAVKGAQDSVRKKSKPVSLTADTSETIEL